MGGGERPTPPAPPAPPRPRAQPGRPSRRRGRTGRVGTVLCAAVRSRSPARASTAGGRQAAAVASRARPPPHPLAFRRRLLAAGGTSQPSPRTPPGPSPLAPTSSAASPAGRPESERADAGKFWEREGRALKGPRPLFSLGGKWARGGLDGARPTVAPRLKEENAQEVCRAAPFGFRAPFPPILPKSFTPPSPHRKSRSCLESVPYSS